MKTKTASMQTLLTAAGDVVHKLFPRGDCKKLKLLLMLKSQRNVATCMQLDKNLNGLIIYICLENCAKKVKYTKKQSISQDSNPCDIRTINMNLSPTLLKIS